MGVNLSYLETVQCRLGISGEAPVVIGGLSEPEMVSVVRAPMTGLVDRVSQLIFPLVVLGWGVGFFREPGFLRRLANGSYFRKDIYLKAVNLSGTFAGVAFSYGAYKTILSPIKLSYRQDLQRHLSDISVNQRGSEISTVLLGNLVVAGVSLGIFMPLSALLRRIPCIRTAFSALEGFGAPILLSFNLGTLAGCFVPVNCKAKTT